MNQVAPISSDQQPQPEVAFFVATPWPSTLLPRPFSKVYTFRTSRRKSPKILKLPAPPPHPLPFAALASQPPRYCSLVPIALASTPLPEIRRIARTKGGIGREQKNEPGARSQANGQPSAFSDQQSNTDPLAFSRAPTPLRCTRHATSAQQHGKARAPCVVRNLGALVILPWALDTQPSTRQPLKKFPYARILYACPFPREKPRGNRFATVQPEHFAGSTLIPQLSSLND
jgi:hypothetical protein